MQVLSQYSAAARVNVPAPVWSCTHMQLDRIPPNVLIFIAQVPVHGCAGQPTELGVWKSQIPTHCVTSVTDAFIAIISFAFVIPSVAVRCLRLVATVVRIASVDSNGSV